MLDQNLSTLITQFLFSKFFQPGEEFYTKDCEQLCKCEPPFVTCNAADCPPKEQCGVQGGVIGCYPEGQYITLLTVNKY